MADVKLNVDLDTNRVTTKLNELRSQLGQTFSGFFGVPQQGMAMGGAPNLGGSGYGQTFTNSAMAYSPHYGAVQAHSTFEQEQAIKDFGLSAAQQQKPPGVAPGAYASSVLSNSIEREVAATHGAAFAARSTFHSVGGGIVAGEMGSVVGGLGGRALGGRIGTKLGLGAGAGRFVGGLAGMLGGYMLMEEAVGGAIEDHYAKVEQIRGVTGELGEIAGAGRGLNRVQRYQLGVSAREAAGDLKMDVNQMGDILALGRQAGMLPDAADPSKAREQYREFARAIEEGAQVLKTSLAGATEVIRAATQSGMSASGGIARAAAAGGAEAFIAQQARMNAFGNMGAAVGIQLGFTGQQGRQTFMGAMGVHSGLTTHQTAALGGPMGAAQFVGSTEMAMAASPMGDIQLMAAMGGGDLGSMGMMGLAGSAMAAMSSGGDFMSNMARFELNKNEIRRGIGKRGIQALARNELRMGGEMIQGFLPDLSMTESMQYYAMSRGMNPDQARAIVAGGRGGGRRRGLSDAAVARGSAALISGRGGMVQGPISREEAEEMAASSEFSLSGAIAGGMTGMALGPKGAAIGAVGGLIAGNYGFFETLVSSDAPSVLASAKEKADFYENQSRAEVDRKEARAKAMLGLYDVAEEDIRRGMMASDDGVGFTFSGTTAQDTRALGAFSAAGYTLADREGALRVPGMSVNLSEVQRDIRRAYETKGVSKKDADRYREMAADIRFGEGRARYEDGRTGVFEYTVAGTRGKVAEMMGSGGGLTKKSVFGFRTDLDMEYGRAAMATLASNDQYTPGEYVTSNKVSFNREQAGRMYQKLAQRTIMALPEDQRKEFLKADGTIDYMSEATTTFVGESVGFTNVEDFRRNFAVEAAAILGKGREQLAAESRAGLAASFMAGPAVTVNEADVLRRTSKELNWDIRSLKFDLGIGEEGEGRTPRKLAVDEVNRVRREMVAEKTEKHQERMGRAIEDVMQHPGYKDYIADVVANKGVASPEGVAARNKAIRQTNLRHAGILQMRDPNEMVDRPGGAAALIRTGGSIADSVSKMLGGEGGTTEWLENSLVTKMTQASEDASMVESEAGADSAKDVKKKGRRKGGGTLSKTVGWGDREDAMSTINRALKHTEKALSKHGKRLEKVEGKVGLNQ